MSSARRLPVVTLLLIAGSLGAAFASVLVPDLPAQFGYLAQAPTVQGALSSLFLHQNLIHLLGNMVFLAAVGATVEQISGSLRFALVYFVSGLVGVLLHGLLVARSVDSPPLVGASGAIAGCAAYYSFRYLQVKVPIAPRLGASIAAVTGVWLLLQVVGAFVTIGAERPATAFWAHIGGFLAGLALSFGFRAPDLGHLLADREILKQMVDRSPGAVLAEAERQLKQRPNDPVALYEMATVLERLGDKEHEIEVRLKMLEFMPEDGQGPALMRLCELGAIGKLPSHRRAALAERLKTSEPATAEALLQSVLDDPAAENQRPDTLLALAGLLFEREPGRARILLSLLLDRYPLHPAVELARARGLL